MSTSRWSPQWCWTHRLDRFPSVTMLTWFENRVAIMVTRRGWVFASSFVISTNLWHCLAIYWIKRKYLNGLFFYGTVQKHSAFHLLLKLCNLWTSPETRWSGLGVRRQNKHLLEVRSVMWEMCCNTAEGLLHWHPLSEKSGARTTRLKDALFKL